MYSTVSHAFFQYYFTDVAKLKLKKNTVFRKIVLKCWVFSLRAGGAWKPFTEASEKNYLAIFNYKISRFVNQKPGYESRSGTVPVSVCFWHVN
jgi:hypothetical protein